MIKKVICVDAGGRKYLTEGDEYDVVRIQDDGDYVVVDDRGKEVKVYADRFEDVYENDDESDYEEDVDEDANTDVNNDDDGVIKNVICIDASGRKYLTAGETYDVVGIQDDGDYIVTDDRGKDVKVLKSRFKDVLDADNDVTDDIEAIADVQDDVVTYENCNCFDPDELEVTITIKGNASKVSDLLKGMFK